MGLKMEIQGFQQVMHTMFSHQTGEASLHERRQAGTDDE